MPRTPCCSRRRRTRRRDSSPLSCQPEGERTKALLGLALPVEGPAALALPRRGAAGRTTAPSLSRTRAKPVMLSSSRRFIATSSTVPCWPSTSRMLFSTSSIAASLTTGLQRQSKPSSASARRRAIESPGAALSIEKEGKAAVMILVLGNHLHLLDITLFRKRLADRALERLVLDGKGEARRGQSARPDQDRSQGSSPLQ